MSVHVFDKINLSNARLWESNPASLKLEVLSSADHKGEGGARVVFKGGVVPSDTLSSRCLDV